MRGMFLRDWRGLWPWLVCGSGLMFLLYAFVYLGGMDAIWYGILLQAYAMLVWRTGIGQDRACGWEKYCYSLSYGRLRYAAEKMLFLLLIWGILLAGAFLGRLIQIERQFQDVAALGISWDEIGVEPFFPTERGGYYLFKFFGEWTEVYAGEIFPGNSVILAVVGFLTIVQIPTALLASPAFSALWDCVTYAAVIFGGFFAKSNGYLINIRTALSGVYKEYSKLDIWNVPWKVLLPVMLILCMISAGTTIWVYNKRNRLQMGKARIRDILIRGIVVALCAVITAAGLQYIRETAPITHTFIYTKSNWDGGTTWLSTNQEPDEIADEYGYEEYTLAGFYPIRKHTVNGQEMFTQVYDGFHGIFLVWDGEWLLWDVSTGTKTPVAFPADPEEAFLDTQILGEDEPVVIAHWKRDNAHTHSGASAFFSIEQNRMITEYLYGSWADDLIDGQIAAEDADGNWVLIDPATGEITGNLPGRP